MLAAITLAVIVPLILFVVRRRPEEKGQLADGIASGRVEATPGLNAAERAERLVVDRQWADTVWTLGRALKTRRFWFLFVTIMCLSIAMNLILAHQPIYTQDKGFSAVFAASIFGIAGFMTLAGNLGGFISDRLGREVTYTISVAGSILGIIALMFASAEQPWLLYAYAALWGVFFGIGGPVGPSADADMFAGPHFGAINGFTVLGFGLGGAIGPWLGGFIFDVTGSYTLAFVIVIAVLSLGCASLWLSGPRQVRRVPGRLPKGL